jgi:hypothetical protein
VRHAFQGKKTEVQGENFMDKILDVMEAGLLFTFLLPSPPHLSSPISFLLFTSPLSSLISPPTRVLPFSSPYHPCSTRILHCWLRVWYEGDGS